MFIIDTPWDCTNYIAQLQGASVDGVIRYYTAQVYSDLPEKRMGLSEAQTLCKAGIKLGIVYECLGSDPTTFSNATGLDDGRYARKYASETIGQPAGSAIYFGVDYDVDDDDITNRILPYFQGIAQAMQENNAYAVYEIGVYGSWIACDRMEKSGIVKLAWLAQSSGWGGTADRATYAASRQWNLMQGFSSVNIGGLDYDPNEVNDSLGSFGQFVVPYPALGNV
jgi:hypothetical protein